jgi:hypothetical protein
MTNDIEHSSYPSEDRVSMLETRAAELESLLSRLDPGYAAASGAGGTDPYSVPAFEGALPEGPGRDGRTESLISQGRLNGDPRPADFARAHWKAVAVIVAAAAVLGGVLAAIAGGSAPAAWPASVTAMRAETAAACRNPDVAAEPSGANFACGAGTQQVLWVFALLTSGGNPGFVDSSTGRRGLEPITPAQGGNVAWSLNLHAPYNPSVPAMSIEVAARAVNNIVAGATLTGTDGQPQVQNGLESSAANCARYTGSGQLLSRPGYPALCARPLTAAGSEALVADVFRQWMPGDPPQTGTDAGVLFTHAADPGDPQVRKILAGLPGGSA